MLNWYAALLHLADPLIKSSSNNYVFQLKDEHWTFFKKKQNSIADSISCTWFGFFEPLKNK
jgi:hypothetical protein